MLTAINSFFSAMDGRQRLLAFVLIVVSSTILLSVIAVGNVTAAVIGIVLLIVLFITRSIWSPDESRRTKISLASLGIIGSAATAYFRFAAKSQNHFTELAKTSNIHPFDFLFDSWIPVAVIFSSLAIVITLINFLARDRLAAGSRPTVEDPMLRRKSFRKRLEDFRQILQVDLSTINNETRWSSQYFVPLDADVEVVSGRRKIRRLQNLLTALRKNHKDKLFLILGDPGSGKSVALRVLCERLLRDIPGNGKIPLYINLKEWTEKESWTRQNPPTVDQLCDFVIGNLRADPESC